MLGADKVGDVVVNRQCADLLLSHQDRDAKNLHIHQNTILAPAFSYPVDIGAGHSLLGKLSCFLDSRISSDQGVQVGSNNLFTHITEKEFKSRITGRYPFLFVQHDDRSRVVHDQGFKEYFLSDDIILDLFSAGNIVENIYRPR